MKVLVFCLFVFVYCSAALEKCAQTVSGFDCTHNANEFINAYAADPKPKATCSSKFTWTITGQFVLKELPVGFWDVNYDKVIFQDGFDMSQVTGVDKMGFHFNIDMYEQPEATGKVIMRGAVNLGDNSIYLNSNIQNAYPSDQEFSFLFFDGSGASSFLGSVKQDTFLVDLGGRPDCQDEKLANNINESPVFRKDDANHKYILDISFKCRSGLTCISDASTVLLSFTLMLACSILLFFFH